MYPPSIDDHVIVKKAMRAIALNRTPGYSFCGNFFDFSYDSADQDHSIVHVKPEAQSIGRNGQIHTVVQAILADMGLATCLRYNIGDRPARRHPQGQSALLFPHQGGALSRRHRKRADGMARRSLVLRRQ